MRVYDPNPQDKLIAKILSEMNILKRGYVGGQLSDKLVVDSLEKIEKLIKQLGENEQAS